MFLGIACVLCLIGGRASGDDTRARTSSLSWLRMPGADSCVATQALARSVEERLGRHVFVSAAEADVSVEGRVEKSKKGSGWHAVLTIRDAKGALLGTRELDRADGPCDSMNEGLALVIAVMIDPEAKLSSSPAPLPPSSASAPSTPAEPAPAPSATPTTTAPAEPPPPPAKPKDPLRVEGDVTAALSDGLAPAVAPGVQIAGMLWLPGIPVGARGYGAIFLPTSAAQDGARGNFDLVYIGSALCPTLRSPLGVATICVGSQVGVLRSHADSKDRGIDEKTMLLWNLVGEVRLTVPIYAPIAITGGVGGVIPVLRPTFLYTSSAGSRENLHKVSLGGLVADVGIAFFFP